MPRQRKDVKPIAPLTQIAPVAQVSQRPALLQMMKEGFGFGIGSALAHRAVASVFSSKSTETVEYEKRMEKYDKDSVFSSKSTETVAYEKCLEKYDKEICKELYN